MLLRESAFYKFTCDLPMSLGMNVESLSQFLGSCNPQDALKIRRSRGADTVSFNCRGGADRFAHFDLQLIQIESEPMEIPKRCYKVVAKLPSSEFQSICHELREFGEVMQVTASKEGISFSVQGNLVSGRVLLETAGGRQASRPGDDESSLARDGNLRTSVLGEFLQGGTGVQLRRAWPGP